jgi:DNA-binding HxlR family transcriptional regulator
VKNALESELVTEKKPRRAPRVRQDWNCFAANCPTRLVLDRIADKWSVLVMSALTLEPLRFSQLMRRVEGISQKVLSQTLKRLERDGLVERTVYATVPVTVEYAMTPLGDTLARSVRVIVTWAESNMDAVLKAQKSYDATHA